MRIRVSLVVLSGLFCVWPNQVAHAGPVENMRQVALAPSDPSMLVVRYVNGRDGLFFTHDAGKTWQMLCTTAIDSALTKIGNLSIASDGTTMMGVFEGLWQDDHTGCNWSMEPALDGQWVSMFARHPSDPGVTFAVVSASGSSSSSSSSSSSVRQGLSRRDASGRWTALGAQEELYINGLAVTLGPSGLRIYESVIKGTISTRVGGMMTDVPNYVLRVSDDEGQSWREHALGAMDGTFRLQTADPQNPERVVAELERDATDDSVLVSADQGLTFNEYQTVAEFGGVVMAPDGRIWIGDSGSSTGSSGNKGLWFGSSLDAPAQKIADYSVTCLGHEATTDTLYVCNKFAFGSTAAGGEFTPLLSFTNAQSLLACKGKDLVAACEQQLCSAFCGSGHFAASPLCTAYHGTNCGPCADDPTSDACLASLRDGGASPTSSDAAATAADAGRPGTAHPKSAPKGCSCAVAGGPVSRAPLGWLTSAALALAGTRRRRRR